MPLQSVENFEETLGRIAPFMAFTVSKAKATFGETWERQFGTTLQHLFTDKVVLENAIKGYVRFALEATKLQKKFEKDRQYIPKSYQEAVDSVYNNEDYMLNLYLPGILLSHYLWPHHYRQLSYFHETFLPKILASSDKFFCDVGVGTGFYSRQILSASSHIEGQAYDISPHSQNYAQRQIDAFGLTHNWNCELRDVIQDTPSKTWPFLVSVEVLEHLEDPVIFLKSLREILQPGGMGFITAALTAPNEDHIYLYNNCQEIIDQLTMSGFEVADYQEEPAYAPRKDEPVPRIAAFIVH